MFFLELKKSYYYIPKDELSIGIDELIKRLREVKFGTSIERIIQEIKEYVDEDYLEGDFTFTNDTIVWKLGIHRFTFYIDFYETMVNHDKLRFNKRYANYTHYHIDNIDIKKTIKEFNEKWSR